MEKLYENIKKLRKEMGMSQDELARRTGYTDRSSISKIEAGEVDLQQSKIALFARALNTTSAELVGWSGDEPAEPFDVDTIITQHYGAGASKHIYKYAKLDRDDRIKTDGFVDGLLANEKYSAKEGSSAGAAM